MRKTVSTLAIGTLLALGAASVSAQSPSYSGPSNSTRTEPAYTGPSSVPVMSVKQLLDTGKDDQHARLQGRIVSHDGGDRYTFEDGTGRITAEIDDDDFPAGQTISAEQRVELLGEYDTGRRGNEFEVDRITLMP